MARPSWLVDGNRIATKIRSASGDPGNVYWKSNPSRTCPSCHYTIDNSDVTQEWPGLPRGVKFDPSDQEIIFHLLAKVGVDDMKPHPFIDEFVPTVHKDDGICYTHPQNLPGVKQDGTISHFFHRAIKAYNTGTRKRRKIHGNDLGDFRWHKTGRTKPVFLDGVQRGCKKIMVLYVGPVKGGGKAEKTNWVMHQYHLGTGEDEREGEYVISKVFYQQLQVKQSEKTEHASPEDSESLGANNDPYTPKTETPEPARLERRLLSSLAVVAELETPNVEACNQEKTIENQTKRMEVQNEIEEGDERKWWGSQDEAAQYLLSSQQLVEGLSLFDELLQSQSPSRDGGQNGKEHKGMPRLSDYRHLGTETFKKDLETCQELVLDPPPVINTEGETVNNSQEFVIDQENIVLETPPERLTQLEFESQDSYLAWGGNKIDSSERGSG
ncbi:unnamed protein product [Cuscuta campestris]|uniref:NAC domain-containing protein n=1 Tax=Cuscuta campestris TaxID=132261 RepID=A0A484MAT9_9ASTE|nr:unnamed protein product [Cuscuta campestris]